MRIAVFAAALAISLTSYAEPADGSPDAEVFQVVGETGITVTYSRPGVKGRVIWGELVPYGTMWRAGANEKTAFEFEDDVVINGETLEAGIYSFYVLPEEDEWTLIFNSNWEGHGAEHDETADVLRFTVTPQAAPHEEWLRYGFEELENEACTAYLHWENKEGRVPDRIGAGIALQLLTAELLYWRRSYLSNPESVPPMTSAVKSPQGLFVAAVIALGVLSFALTGAQYGSARRPRNRLQEFMARESKLYSQFDEELLIRSLLPG
jgi:hypothetical protein